MSNTAKAKALRAELEAKEHHVRSGRLSCCRTTLPNGRPTRWATPCLSLHPSAGPLTRLNAAREHCGHR